ncbi:MAG TPA: FecR domain-containing protein, partial [Opitutaceae bacterium]|nr:FecR domain-containing protein [Opitutaceae bacterium]
MHNRVLSWLFFCAFAAVVSVRAQAPAAPASPPPGLVLVAKVTGTATKTLNGVRTALKVDDKVEQTAKINTGLESSVVLAFSNGATTQLGADTELVIDEFLQDPFASTIQVANIEEEPSRSNTKLSLNKGELVGKVAKLKRTSGSTFTVQTPVGAAGIRGTTFRIVYRPTGTGQAFNFILTTVEGNVEMTLATGTINATAPVSVTD